MNAKVAKKLRQQDRRLRKEIDAQLKVTATELIQIIKEEWPWKEKFGLVWFLLFSKKEARIEL